MVSWMEESPNYSSSYFDEEIKFTGELNFAKLTGWEPLEGLKGFGEVRWRDGLNPNLRVGASSNFQPSHFQSGKQWRLDDFRTDLHHSRAFRC